LEQVEGKEGWIGKRMRRGGRRLKEVEGGGRRRRWKEVEGKVGWKEEKVAWNGGEGGEGGGRGGRGGGEKRRRRDLGEDLEGPLRRCVGEEMEIFSEIPKKIVKPFGSELHLERKEEEEVRERGGREGANRCGAGGERRRRRKRARRRRKRKRRRRGRWRKEEEEEEKEGEGGKRRREKEREVG